MVGKETPAIKYDRALTLFQESVLEPNHKLRACAHNQGCFDELMEIREHVLQYLKTLREVTHHTYADESDETEDGWMRMRMLMRTVMRMMMRRMNNRGGRG